MRTLLIDIDGVLTNVEKWIIDKTKSKFGLEITRDDIKYSHIMKNNKKINIADELLGEDYYLNVQPRDYANVVVPELAKKFDVMFVTSRHKTKIKNIGTITLEWLKRNILDANNLVVMYADELDRVFLKFDYLIDDNPFTLAQLQHDARLIQFKTPYNRHVVVEQNVENWHQIEEFFKKPTSANAEVG